MTRRRKILFPFLLILSLFIGGLVWYVSPLLGIAVGYATKMACSCAFLQGRELADISDRDLNFSILSQVNLKLDEETRSVKGSLLGGLVSRRAYFLAGRGCVLQSAPSQPMPSAHRRAATSVDRLRPWPYGDLVVDSLLTGIDSAALSDALDLGMQPLAGGGARGIVVLYRGQLAAERYATGFGPDIPQLGWSMTKSITNALVGILVKNGKLDLERNALFPDWRDDERRDITVDDLLHMNSGLGWNEEYGSTSDATRMLYLQADMAHYAADQPLAHPIGTHWQYSSGTSNLLSQIIHDQFPDDAAYLDFIYDSLFLPLGMYSAVVETDQSGTAVGSSYGWATPRDWARFGQLYLQDGLWDGRRILPEGWVDYSRRAAAGSEGGYGAHLWLSEGDPTDDAFIFRGFQDQRVFIIPSRQCVIVRVGKNDDRTANFSAFVAAVLRALPKD